MNAAAAVGGQNAGPTFSCTFVNAEFFAALVAILREFVDVLGAVDSPELMIVREGIKIKMMDSAHVFLVDFELYTDSAFSEFIVNGGTHVIALKIEPLHNVCKHFKKNDVVRMYTKSSDVCFINVARHEKFGQRTMTYKLHQIMLINHEHLDMPETAYKCQAMLPTDVFLAVANELRDTGGEKVVISISNDSIQFKSKNESGEAVIVMRSDGVAAGNFGVTCSSPSEETFMLKHFNRMVKAATLKQTDACLIMLEDNKPLSVAFDVNPYGAVQFFLAPLLPPQ